MTVFANFGLFRNCPLITPLLPLWNFKLLNFAYQRHSISHFFELSNMEFLNICVSKPLSVIFNNFFSNGFGKIFSLAAI